MKDWGASYQLLPPNVHRRNEAERAIRTFKSHFMAILEGVDPEFPKFMWDNLLVQTELTINLLRQATINPMLWLYNQTLHCSIPMLTFLGLWLLVSEG